ncbi:unnamed protein product [Rotaria sp. Silwood1]|nr:unnamed protein product [Rotaria sp. Silwood1]
MDGQRRLRSPEQRRLLQPVRHSGELAADRSRRAGHPRRRGHRPRRRDALQLLRVAGLPAEDRSRCRVHAAFERRDARATAGLVQDQRPAPRRAAPDGRAAPHRHPAGQREEARADARHCRREAARDAGAAPGRELQAGGRAAGAGAQGPGRDAEPGARRRLAEPRADQCEDARRVRRSAAGGPAGSGLHGRAVRRERGRAAGLQRAGRPLRAGAEEAGLLRPAARSVQRPRRAGGRRVGGVDADRPHGPVHGDDLPAQPRGNHRPPAAGAAGAVHAGHQAVGGCAGRADDRHAGQRPHAARHGGAAAAHRRHRLGHRHHRHHRRAHGGHAGRPASAEDRDRHQADGRGMHHQRHPPADRADHRPPGHRPGRHHHQGHAGRCAEGGDEAHRLRRRPRQAGGGPRAQPAGHHPGRPDGPDRPGVAGRPVRPHRTHRRHRRAHRHLGAGTRRLLHRPHAGQHLQHRPRARRELGRRGHAACRGHHAGGTRPVADRRAHGIERPSRHGAAPSGKRGAR